MAIFANKIIHVRMRLRNNEPLRFTAKIFFTDTLFLLWTIKTVYETEKEQPPPPPPLHRQPREKKLTLQSRNKILEKR